MIFKLLQNTTKLGYPFPDTRSQMPHEAELINDPTTQFMLAHVIDN